MNTLDDLFRVPDPTARPLRILVFSQAKRGKSHFVQTATQVGPLFWIDTERGSDFYDPHQGHGFRVLYEKDPDKAAETVSMAHALSMQGGARPIVAIDSMSSLWFEQQEVAEKITRGSRRPSAKDRANFRSWAVAKKPLKRLNDAMMGATCHVIITAREKDEFSVSASGEPTKVGVKPDVEKNLPYAVDFIVHMGVDELKMGVPPKPDNYWARVVGTRTPPGEGAIEIGTVFRDPKFSDFMVADRQGATPAAVKGSATAQAEREMNAPQTWHELLERALPLCAEWDADKVKEMLKKKFGGFDSADLADYFDWLKEQASGA